MRPTSRAGSISVHAPAAEPIATTAPSGFRRAKDPAKSSPPTGSTMTSTVQILRQLVVDVRLLGAELAAHVELLRRADCRDHAGAERARDLDRRRADAARARVHEHRRAAANAHLPRERDVRGEERQQERRALGEARAVGQQHDLRAVDRGELCVAAAARRERHHARSVLELARDLGAEHGGQLRHLRIAAAPDEHVGEVDPGRAHAHEHLPVVGRRVGNVDELERPVDAR